MAVHAPNVKELATTYGGFTRFTSLFQREVILHQRQQLIKRLDTNFYFSTHLERVRFTQKHICCTVSV